MADLIVILLGVLMLVAILGSLIAGAYAVAR